MNDLIDLGNLVFNVLLKNHDEEEVSRTLFLYAITQGQRYYIIGSNKTLSFDNSGVSTNFEDAEIAELDKQWKAKIQQAKEAKADKILRAIKTPNQQPKDGDIFNFWNNDDGSEWREIKL